MEYFVQTPYPVMIQMRKDGDVIKKKEYPLFISAKNF